MASPAPPLDLPRVVIAGAGFAGLWAARSLAGCGCSVTLVDRHNYHTFPALLYQVAAAELQAEDIVYPLRSILWGLRGVRFLFSAGLRVDPLRRVLETEDGALPYDYLILATGSVPDPLGVPGVREQAFFLKTLDQAVALRNHIVRCFEAASTEANEETRRRLLSFVIVGGGATGVEYAGALAELIRGPLARDYPDLGPRPARITLLEAGAALLPGLPERIQEYAARRLRSQGVDVRTGTAVDRVDVDDVHLSDGGIVPTETPVWTAGVRGEPLAELSGLAGADGRIEVLPTLQVPGHPDIFVAGDLARILVERRPLPLVAQVALQSGTAAAGNVLRRIAGREPRAFRYRDRGLMVAIGRNAAGAVLGGRTYVGFPAWLLWLGVHLYKLIGFRNRLLVLINWAWDYSVYKRAARVVFPSDPEVLFRPPWRLTGNRGGPPAPRREQ